MLFQEQRVSLPVRLERAVVRVHGRDGVEHRRHGYLLPANRARAVRPGRTHALGGARGRQPEDLAGRGLLRTIKYSFAIF